MNIGTLLAAILVFGVILLAVFRVRKDVKSGGCSGCEGCGGSFSSHAGADDTHDGSSCSCDGSAHSK